MQKEYSISYADTDFLNALKEGESGKVHSIYKNCINFDINGVPLTLFGNKGENAPSSAVLKEDICFIDFAFEPSQSVYLKNNLLYLNKLPINFRNSIKTDSTFPTNIPLPQKDMMEKYILKLYDIKNSILKILYTDDYFVKNTLFTLFDGFETLINSLIKEKDIKSSVNRILGLGFGLTPSGDDMLTGLMLTLRFFKGGEPYFKTLKTHVEERFSTTTDVSKWMLTAATQGKGRASILDLLSNIANENINIDSMISKVTSIGSTSGKDTCIGICAGLYLLKEITS